MSTTHGGLPVGSLESGRSYLCLGPPMVGKETLLWDLLSPTADGAAVAVLTETDPETFFAAVDGPDDRVRVVDCTGELRGVDPVEDERVRRVSSPADLTGIAIAVSEFVESFDDRGLAVRVGLDCLTTLSTYVTEDRLAKLLHKVVQMTSVTGGTFVATLHTDTLETEVLETIGVIFDGRIQIQEGHDGPILRVDGPGAEPTEWVSFDADHPEGSSVPSDGDVAGPSVDSLGALINRVEEERLTLTVHNYDGDLEELRSSFDRLNVDVETAATGAVPDGVCILHRDDEFLAAEGVDALLSSISFDGPQGASGDSALLSVAQRGTVGASGVDKATMVRASRSFEELAYRHGNGRLHAGFQRLSVFTRDDHVKRIYDGIARAGVETHIYGAPDDTVDHDSLVVHGSDEQEIRESWFVVYRGPTAAGALVAEERNHGHFTGFWTYRAPIVASAIEYVESAY